MWTGVLEPLFFFFPKHILYVRQFFSSNRREFFFCWARLGIYTWGLYVKKLFLKDTLEKLL